MDQFTNAVLLGVGIGAIYAVLAQGIVLIYRGSGVLNFAHGAYAMVGAYTFDEMIKDTPSQFLPGLPTMSKWPAFAVAVLLTAALGALTDRLVMARLKQASALARIIATLGVLVVLQSAATLRYGGALVPLAESLLPRESAEVLGTTVGVDRLWLLGIACVLTAVLYGVFRFTRVGLATSAVAENEEAAAALGWSPAALSTTNWTVGAGLAAIAGILIAPISGLDISRLSLYVIAALAAALIGGFSSFPLTLAGGLVIGVGEQLARDHTDITGADTALPFLVIVVVLAVRGTSLPVRGHLLDRLPALGTGRIRWPNVIAVVAVTAVLVGTVLSRQWVVGITISLLAAIVMLSIVVLTGYAGQVSLAQFAFAGVGALIAGRLVTSAGWPFELATLAAVLLTVPVGLLLGLPALRTRGVNLAVVTLGLGLAVQSVVFNSADFTGTDGIRVRGEQTVLGVDVNATRHPERYGLVALAAFVVCALAVANLRRGRTGRQMIAMRANERAAASLGINVLAAKLHAFGLSAGIAALGGVLLAFRTDTIEFLQSFHPFQSIYSVAFATIGGVGFVAGPLLGSTLSANGVGSVVGDTLDSIHTYLPLIGGVALLVFLVRSPDGMVAENLHLLRRLRLVREPDQSEVPLAAVGAHRVSPGSLELRGLTVRFGGTVALDDVDLEVRAGEVVGLIGPNGAGKTTLVDAVSAFVRPSAGEVLLNGSPVGSLAAHRRVRLGLTRSFQGLELFEDLTVLENLRTASDERRASAMVTDLVWPGAPPLPPAAVAAVREFELAADLHRKPSELPYGRRRLVAIARAIATEPSVLLLDEPAAGLDSQESAELGRLVRRLADEWGIAVLVIEHDMDFVFGVSDRIVVLEFGRKIAEGTPDAVRADAAVRIAYLGESEPELAEAVR